MANENELVQQARGARERLDVEYAKSRAMVNALTLERAGVVKRIALDGSDVSALDDVESRLSAAELRLEGLGAALRDAAAVEAAAVARAEAAKRAEDAARVRAIQADMALKRARVFDLVQELASVAGEIEVGLCRLDQLDKVAAANARKLWRGLNPCEALRLRGWRLFVPGHSNEIRELPYVVRPMVPPDPANPADRTVNPAYLAVQAEKAS